MSHSSRRATSHNQTRVVLGVGAFVKRLINDKRAVLDTSTATRVRRSLRAAFEKQSIEQQQDHGADDRHDPARDVILARKDPTNPGPY
jgi:hypothetical protein